MNKLINTVSARYGFQDRSRVQYQNGYINNEDARRLIKLQLFHHLIKQSRSGHWYKHWRYYETVPTLLWTEAGIISLLIIACAIHPVVVAVIYICLALWSLRGAHNSIQSLTLCFMITMLNPAIFPVVVVSSSLRWPVFIAASIRLISDSVRGKIPVLKNFGSLILYAAVLLILSALFSGEASFSLSKSVIFILGAAAIIAGFNLAKAHINYWKSWFLTLYFVTLAISIPALFIPSVGRHVNGMGFQGILNHPQAFAVFVCPMVAWLSGMLMFEKRRSFLLILGVIVGWASMFLSLARTALLAVIISFLWVVVVGLLRDKLSRSVFLQGVLNKFSLIAIGLVGAAVMFSWSALQDKGEAFLKKGRSNLSITQSIEESRGDKIYESVNNFLQHPWTGIGFGMMSRESGFKIETAGPLNIATGARSEKSFLPTAVLEETGIVGAICFLIFISFFIWPLLKHSGLPAIWLMGACLTLNLGEMVFFSFGGIGLYIWLLMGLSRVIRYGDSPSLSAAVAVKNNLRLKINS